MTSQYYSGSVYSSLAIATAMTCAFFQSPNLARGDVNAVHPAPAAAHHITAGTTPEAALKELQDGNARFTKGTVKHSHQDEARRKELTLGQKPQTIILSCSDSRVSPEVVFDQGLGDVFVIRVAGNILGAAQVASIEYAVEHLGTRLILVMGHESCGAVTAAAKTPPDKTAGSPDLDTLVSSIRPSFDGLTQLEFNSALEDKKLSKLVNLNVNYVAKRLVERSAIVRHAVESGNVKVARGVYQLESGIVQINGSSESDPHSPARVLAGEKH